MVRKASWCLLILAQFVLLGHDLLPHHHHGALPCFTGEHCPEKLPEPLANHTKDRAFGDELPPDNCLLEDLLFTRKTHNISIQVEAGELTHSIHHPATMGICIQTPDIQIWLFHRLFRPPQNHTRTIHLMLSAHIGQKAPPSPFA